MLDMWYVAGDPDAGRATFLFNQNNNRINNGDIRDYSWTYDEQFGKVKQFRKKLATRSIDIIFFQRLPEFHGKAHLNICVVKSYVRGQQSPYITNTHFLVGKSQCVSLGFAVISLDGEITTLVKNAFPLSTRGHIFFSLFLFINIPFYQYESARFFFKKTFGVLWEF